jgi:hypothetical protein
MIIQANDYTYFMLLARLCTENEFISAAVVRSEAPGTDFVNRMYCCLFNGLANVSLDYEKYYKIEYEDLWQYLENCYYYSINSGILRTLKTHYSPGLNVFSGDAKSGGDYVMAQYIMSHEGFPMIEKILTKATKRDKQ